MRSGWSIGIDIGGTKIAIGQVDEKGQIHESARFSSNFSPEEIQQKIVDSAKKLIESSLEPIHSIGVAMAGQINTETGLILFAPNLKWHNVPLGKNLSEALSLPVFVTNDVRAATWGEWKHGAGQESEHFVCLFVGTGVGGGIVSHGKMLSGYTNTAGEMGHMVIDLKGAPCSCGNRGCVEAYAGGWAIAKRAQEKLKARPWQGKELLRLADEKIENITAKTVARAASIEDPLALKVIDEAINALTACSVNIVNSLNPQRLIFGGGIIQGMPYFIDRINQGIRKQALKTATQKLEVMKAFLLDAGVVGAAAFARERII